MGIKNVINMDGIEWRRGKWGRLGRFWLYINEKLGAWLGNHLIADHPEIKKHLVRFVSGKKISVIPYGADILQSADQDILGPCGLEKYEYTVLIARPEPENSVLEIVKAYSRDIRVMPLVILGDYAPDSNNYHKQIVDEASSDVKFIGAIYNKKIVQALLYFARFYIHGHTVGGTNPSLVAALGAGSPVLAHDNRFNRWVAGEGAIYFSSEIDCAEKIQELLDNDNLITRMRKHSRSQISNHFTLGKTYDVYEKILLEKLY